MKLHNADDTDAQMISALQAEGYDLSSPQLIELIVEFNSWPPHEKAVSLLRQHYESVELVMPDEDDEGKGYVAMFVTEKVTYPFVVSAQQTLGELMVPFNGHCAGWSVA